MVLSLQKVLMWIILESMKSDTLFYITILDMWRYENLNIYKVSSLYLIFGKLNGYFEEIKWK